MVLFSVVITTYNRAGELRRTLQSLVEQTYKNFEVHVTDDGSIDDTRSVIAEFEPKLELYYYWQKNWGGPARGRNVGMQHSKGEWVAFLDADDWWYPEKLSIIAKLTPGIDVIYHELNYYNKFGPMNRKTNGRKLRNPYFEDLLINGNCLSNSATCVRRAILKRVGGVSEDRDLIAVEDYDLWLRISRISERFIYLSQSLGAYWEGEGTLSTHSWNYIKKIQNVTGRYINELEGRNKKEAILREKYIVARNKKALDDKSALVDFFNITLYSKNLGLKIKSFIFGVMTLFGIQVFKKFRLK